MSSGKQFRDSSGSFQNDTLEAPNCTIKESRLADGLVSSAESVGQTKFLSKYF